MPVYLNQYVLEYFVFVVVICWFSFQQTHGYIQLNAEKMSQIQSSLLTREIHERLVYMFCECYYIPHTSSSSSVTDHRVSSLDFGTPLSSSVHELFRRMKKHY